MALEDVKVFIFDFVFILHDCKHSLNSIGKAVGDCYKRVLLILDLGSKRAYLIIGLIHKEVQVVERSWVLVFKSIQKSLLDDSELNGPIFKFFL